MAEVQRLIERLKSTSSNTRYDACKELRVATSLPEEASAAL
jgi:hypothetical protein